MRNWIQSLTCFNINTGYCALQSIVGGSWWYFSKETGEKENAHNAAVAAYVDVLQRIGLSVDDANTIANLKYSEDIQSNKLGFQS